MDLERETHPPTRLWRAASLLLLALAAGATIAAFAIRLARAPASITPPAVHVHVWPAPDPGDGLNFLTSGVEEGEKVKKLRPSPGVALDAFPGLLEAWYVVAASRDVDTVALVGDRVVAVSRDDGGTFERHELPGDGGVCRQLAVNGRGTVFVLCPAAEAPLGVFAPGEAPRWTKLPAASSEIFWFDAAGEWLVIGDELQEAHHPSVTHLIVSRDEGRTFTVDERTPRFGNDANAARLEPDGTLVAMRGDEAACGGGGQDRDRLALAGGDPAAMPWPLDSPGAFWIGAGGWAYGIGMGDECGGRDEWHLCAVGPDPDVPPVPGPPRGDGPGIVDFATNGKITYAIVHERLYRVRGGAFRRLDATPPAGLATGPTVDHRGRLVALANGHAVRWSADEGWRLLLVP